jgi:hypothetical protein
MKDQKIEKMKEKKKKNPSPNLLMRISNNLPRRRFSISRERLTSISEQFAKDSACERERERERERFISISEQFVEDSAFERETDS